MVTYLGVSACVHPKYFLHLHTLLPFLNAHTRRPEHIFSSSMTMARLSGTGGRFHPCLRPPSRSSTSGRSSPGPAHRRQCCPRRCLRIRRASSTKRPGRSRRRGSSSRNGRITRVRRSPTSSSTRPTSWAGDGIPGTLRLQRSACLTQALLLLRINSRTHLDYLLLAWQMKTNSSVNASQKRSLDEQIGRGRMCPPVALRLALAQITEPYLKLRRSQAARRGGH
jgi:hypothetical protein